MVEKANETGTKKGEGQQNSEPSLAGIAAAGTALVAGIGGLTLTGTIGRVQRNHGEFLMIAFGLVLIGAACWLIASLPTTPEARKKRWHRAGIIASVVGLGLGLGTAVVTTSEDERPTVAAELSEDALTVKGTVKVANLGSDERLVVLIDGLTQEGDTFSPTTIFQAYVGPDSDGKVDLPVHAHVRPALFGSVGIRAFTSEEERPCDEYPRRVSGGGNQERREKTKTGCVILPLPQLTLRPQLTASWEGKDRQANSLRVTVKAANAPRVTAIQVVGVSGKKRPLLHRERAESTVGGRLDRDIRLPIAQGISSICAEAGFLGPDAKLAPPRCPVGRRPGDNATVQLRVPH